MTVELGICLTAGAAAALTDWRSRKVRNVLVIPLFMAGLIRALAAAEGVGPLDALVGGALPLILFPLFALRMLGAGDIKLLMALGVWLGMRGSASLMVYSIFAGGFLALGVMLIRRNGLRRLKRLQVYLTACLLSRKLIAYEDFTTLEPGDVLPFALAVLGGLICLWAQMNGVLPQII